MPLRRDRLPPSNNLNTNYSYLLKILMAPDTTGVGASIVDRSL